MSKNSTGWKRAPGAGFVIVGMPGAGPRPFTTKLRVADHGESMNPVGPPMSWAPLTRQKYVPLASPLTLASVGNGTSGPAKLLKPVAMTAAKLELVLTS